MKNKIILFTILTSLSFVSSAEDKLYIKKLIGVNRIEHCDISSEKYQGKDKFKDSISLNIAIGKKLENDIRLELGLKHLTNAISKEVTDGNLEGFNDNDRYVLNHKLNASLIHLTVYKDLHNFGKFSHFVGIGGGVSINKEKVSGYVVNKENDQEKKILDETSSKTKYNFAYKLVTGLDFKVKEGLNLEVSYSFINLGKNKPRQINGENLTNKRNYFIHSLQAGLRYEI